MFNKKRNMENIWGELNPESKYLAEIKGARENYGLGFLEKNDSRLKEFVNEKRKYGVSSPETWSLDLIMAEWMYTRFSMLKEVGGKIVDYTFHHEEVNGKDISCADAINMIIEASKNYIINYEADDEKVIVQIENDFRNALIAIAHFIRYLWW